MTRHMTEAMSGPAESSGFLCGSGMDSKAGLKASARIYRNLLAMALDHRKIFVPAFLLVALGSLALVPFLGENFFPSVDSGEIALHVRPPVGMRIEDASTLFGEVEQQIRQVVPPSELQSIVDNIGLPTSSINTIYNNSGLIGYQDGDIFVSLKEGHHPTAGYVRQLRKILPEAFPGTTFSFLPADIISQILNFGSPAPLDVQIIGQRMAANQAYAVQLLRQMQRIPGIADVRIQQSADNPQLNVAVNRSRIGQFGLTELDVTNSVATALAGTSQTAPAYWLDQVKRRGISHRRAGARIPGRYALRSRQICRSPVPGGLAPSRCWVVSHRSPARSRMPW